VTMLRILRKNGYHAPSVTPEALISDAIDALKSDDTGALVVSSDGVSIQGIISERDIVRGLQKYGASALDLNVATLMTKKIITCTAGEPAVAVLAKMHRHHVRHIPVVNEGKLDGIVNIRNIVELRLDEMQQDAKAMCDNIAHA